VRAWTVSTPIDRRTLLRTATAGAVVAAAAPHATAQHAAARSSVTAADWRALARDLDGRLLRRDSRGFRRAARLFDPRWDDRVPTAVVQAEHADDVATALAFARRHSIPMRPRSGGHSYVGASTVQGGLVVSTRGLRRIRYTGGEVTVGAGVRLLDLHEALDPHGRTVPTGTCPTVAAAGLTLGGGIGPESRALGLTCDALVAATVVTADGRTRHVDAEHHADLFWALRGGGGGNVGIVTALRFDTSRARPMGFAFLSWPQSAGAAVLSGWQRRLARAPRSASATVHVDATPDGADVRITVVSLTGDAHDEAQALARSIGHDPSGASFRSTSHLEGVHVLAGSSTGRQSFTAGSDVLAARLGPAVARRLVAVVADHGRAGGSGSLLVDPLGGAIGHGRGAFPWRDADAIVQWYAGLPDDARPSAVRAARRWIDAGHDALRGSSAGGYVNYLEPGRRVASYYGDAYARMRRLRRRLDPHGLFDTPWSVPR
jgi:FAD/FMN-containing dehydrogenase